MYAPDPSQADTWLDVLSGGLLASAVTAAVAIVVLVFTLRSDRRQRRDQAIERVCARLLGLAPYVDAEIQAAPTWWRRRITKRPRLNNVIGPLLPGPRSSLTFAEILVAILGTATLAGRDHPRFSDVLVDLSKRVNAEMPIAEIGGFEPELHATLALRAALHGIEAEVGQWIRRPQVYRWWRRRRTAVSSMSDARLSDHVAAS